MPADDGLADVALTAATLARLRAALPAAVRPFAAHVTRQVAHPPGAVPAAAGAADAREAPIAAAVIHLVARAMASDDAGDAASRLAHDAVLLSACFQNLDLLPPDDPAGDAVALLVFDATERLRDG